MRCRYADDCVCAFRFREDAESFYRVLPKRLGKCGLKVAPEKTQVLRFSRFHPSMKRRFTFLGFELYWFPDRQGEMRVMHRTSRKRLQGACRRIKEWIRDNRHLKGKQFIQELNRRLQGHYNTTDSEATANRSTASTDGPSSVRSNGSTEGAETEKLYLGSVRKSTGPIRHCPPENHRGSAAARGLCMNILFDAKASTTEEPDAGKLHVRVCAGCALESA
jgi:Reverse transcriptase (RNA-dependent DNA polymerase).